MSCAEHATRVVAIGLLPMQNEVEDTLKLCPPKSAVSSVNSPCELCNALIKKAVKPFSAMER